MEIIEINQSVLIRKVVFIFWRGKLVNIISKLQFGITKEGLLSLGKIEVVCSDEE